MVSARTVCARWQWGQLCSTPYGINGFGTAGPRNPSAQAFPDNLARQCLHDRKHPTNYPEAHPNSLQSITANRYLSRIIAELQASIVLEKPPKCAIHRRLGDINCDRPPHNHRSLLNDPKARLCLFPDTLPVIQWHPLTTPMTQPH